jgi:thiol-disulfide isomerase/thioredoxin
MKFITNKGENVKELVQNEEVLLVFLRHFGCTFCRETMASLAKDRYKLECKGAKIVVVHMAHPKVANEMLDVYGLHNISHISDKDRVLYRLYGLKKASIRAMFGIKNWWRAFDAGLLKGHLIGSPIGNPYQMPGVFVFKNNQLHNKYIYRHVSDRPNFLKLVA